jgi:hypothetical protein
MSNYIRALKRLEEDAPRPTAPRPAAPVAERPGQPEIKRAPVARREPAPTVTARLPAVAQPRVGSSALEEFGALFDALELFAKGHDRCTVVFAPVSRRESIGRLMAGLAAHAEQRRRRAFLAELRAAADRSTLSPRSASRAGDESAAPIEVDTARDGAGPLLRDWLDAQAGDATFVFVEAPPLSESQDAIVLASACDGIVLVAESEITDRATLQGAAERVRSGDCSTLGIAVIGSSDPMPSWLRRLLAPARLTA